MEKIKIEGPRLVIPAGKDDHILGDHTGVTLFMYGDYQCPASAEAYQVVKKLLEHFESHFRFIFRHFPRGVHPLAYRAAEAAEAAASQGKFWAMHNVLFEHQNAFDEESLIEYAARLRLNVPRFISDMSQEVHTPKIRKNILSGELSGVDGTPFFFLNGMRLRAVPNAQTLVTAIQETA